MNESTMTEHGLLDAEAINAIRGGDAERYCELIERYERRVFAIAWSRLGDATLAQEAAQETFIRAYRQLASLNNGRKFSSWISSIARNITTNLGLRHRRELRNRQRWALEQVVARETEPAEEPFTPETLRQTLEELPAAHRECLVLFYLEGKNGSEAAVALGISEAAFRVRLHRARIAMRTHLDRKLEDSLEKLRPAKPLTPAIMGVVLISGSSAKAAGAAGIGASAKTAAGWGNVSWCMLFPLIASLPGAVMAWFIGKVERSNFRDPEGFRSKLHQNYFRTFFWGFPVVFVLSIYLTGSFHRMETPGITVAKICGVLLFSYLVCFSGRSLYVARNSCQVGMFFYALIIAAGCSAGIMGLYPRQWVFVPVILANILMVTLLPRRPVRMDYNLYLRASQGLLRVDSGRIANKVEQLTADELLMFARFLGGRWPVHNFRWEANGLYLQLPPVGTKFLKNLFEGIMPFFRKQDSWIRLARDGSVEANIGTDDFADIAALSGGHASRDELGHQVSRALERAWSAFRMGELKIADETLGNLKDSEVFLVPPDQAQATKLWRFITIAAISLMLISLLISLVLSSRDSKSGSLPAAQRPAPSTESDGGNTKR